MVGRFGNGLGFCSLIGCYLGLLFCLLLGRLQLFTSGLGFGNQLSVVAVQGFQHVPGGGELFEGRSPQDHIEEVGVAGAVHVTSAVGKTALVLFDLSGLLFNLLLSLVYTVLSVDLLLMSRFVVGGSLIELVLVLVELLQSSLGFRLLIVRRSSECVCCGYRQANGKNSSERCVQGHLRLGSAHLFSHMKEPPSAFALTLRILGTYP